MARVVRGYTKMLREHVGVALSTPQDNNVPAGRRRQDRFLKAVAAAWRAQLKRGGVIHVEALGTFYVSKRSRRRKFVPGHGYIEAPSVKVPRWRPSTAMIDALGAAGGNSWYHEMDEVQREQANALWPDVGYGDQYLYVINSANGNVISRYRL
jgi:nucleoid DNA-binding protein